MSQHIDELTLSGVRSIVGGSTCTVLMRDKYGDVLIAAGASVPTAGAAGFAKGCLFVNTAAAAGTKGLYENQGSASSVAFGKTGSSEIMVPSATIATTGDTDAYVIAPQAGVLTAAMFSGADALAAADDKYITFSITNLGQAGAGTASMLAATETTKATGGTAIVAGAKREMTLTATSADLAVAAGDRLRIRATATGTLPNTVTFPVYLLVFAE